MTYYFRLSVTTHDKKNTNTLFKFKCESYFYNMLNMSHVNVV